MAPSHCTLLAVLLVALLPATAAPISISEVQFTSDPGGDSPYLGQVVTVRGVVTAVYSSGFALQDSVGAWSGIWVYDPGHSPERGDSLELTGTVAEYYGLTEFTDIATYQVLGTASDLPPPIDVTAASVATGGVDAESYEGVLVRCHGLEVADASVGFGDFLVGDSTGQVLVGDQSDYLYTPENGDSIKSVTGVLLYSFSEFRIEPRDDEDIERTHPTRFALRGTVVTPDQVINDTYVVVNGRRIESVGIAPPGGVPAYDTGGIIFPALIDAHNHPAYNVFDLLDLGQLFNNRYEWQSDPDYLALRTIYNNLVAAGLFNQMWKYAEVRALIWGAGSIQGARSGSTWDAFAHAKILTRNLERWPGRVYSTIFPLNTSASTRQSIKDGVAGGVYRATVIHLSEGTDSTSLAEFYQWQSWGMLDSSTVIIHGVPYGPAEFTAMATTGASLVWSPRSNLVLYGQTADIPAAVAAGVAVSLGPDWCVSGSKGMIEELALADSLNQADFGGVLSNQDLVAMVTTNPAEAFGRAGELGRIAPGYLADFTVVRAQPGDAYGSLIDATPEDVLLVVVEGQARYGVASLMDALNPGLDMDAFYFCDAVERKVRLRLDDPTVSGSEESLADLQGPIDTEYPDLLSLVPCVVTTAVGSVPDLPPSRGLVLHAGPIPFRHDVRLYLTREVGGVQSRMTAQVEAAHARVIVYDVAGRQLRVLHDGPLAGGQRLTWNGRDDKGLLVSSGVYFVRATVGGSSVARSVVLLR